ncbi:MAG TPA: adenosylcobinamide-GDP ribazoletransferase [Micromonosporaceae bacterium]|nr:adenosylcobinamide-GDP ribazoletransferase [Micromonosporaceae bacterium]
MPDGRLTAGVRLALTTFTVAPLRPGPVDRTTAAIAMPLAPALGAALGAVLAGAGLGLRGLGAPALLAAAVAVALGVLLTRGLHLDGLADTADGLGSYTDAGTALAIMRKPDVGAFGVAAVVLTLLIQSAALAAVLVRPWPAALLGTATALAAGRLAATVACRRGVPAARGSGLGALVAGVVGWPAMLAGTAAVAALSVAAVADRPWQGPVAVVGSLAVAVLLTRHAVRRLGGITGDVLGAGIECATTVALLVLALG